MPSDLGATPRKALLVAGIGDGPCLDCWQTRLGCGGTHARRPTPSHALHSTWGSLKAAEVCCRYLHLMNLFQLQLPLLYLLPASSRFSSGCCVLLKGKFSWHWESLRQRALTCPQGRSSSGVAHFAGPELVQISEQVRTRRRLWALAGGLSPCTTVGAAQPCPSALWAGCHLRDWGDSPSLLPTCDPTPKPTAAGAPREEGSGQAWSPAAVDAAAPQRCRFKGLQRKAAATPCQALCAGEIELKALGFG